MKIIILGAGQVGRTVAEMMATEDNDITVVDIQANLLAELQQRLDIRTVVGHASHPKVLYRAGIDDADLIFAVTNDDETNMIACQVAYSLFNTPLRLARVRSSDYVSRPGFFRPADMPVDFVINPEEMVTRLLQRLIDHAGATEIYSVAENQGFLVGVRAHAGAPVTGGDLAALDAWLGQNRSCVAAVFRNNKSVAVEEGFEFQPEDEIFFLTAQADVTRLISGFCTIAPSNHRVIIAGGGNLGKRLASFVESDYHVKVLERDPDRCWHLAGALKSTIVLNGDVTDPTFLVGEGIEESDVFCALTDHDKTNVVASLLAKRLGAIKAISIVNNSSHAAVAQNSGVDIAFSPAQVTIGAVLTHMRRGDIVNVYSLRYGTAEVIELIVHGDDTHSQVVGRAIKDLPLTHDVTIGAILRRNELIIPRGETVIEPEDQLVVVVTDKQRVETVQQLFQVESIFV